MTKPKGNPNEIPSSQKEHSGPKKTGEPLKLEGSSEGAASEHDDQKRKKTHTVRERLRKVGTFLKKIPPFGYLATLHADDRPTFWIVIFTALLVYFTYRLVVVTEKVDDTTRETQRAFVSYVGLKTGNIQWDPVTKAITEVEVIPTWENSGTTPVKRAFTHINVEPRPDPLPKGFNFPYIPERGSFPFVLGPKRSISVSPLRIPGYVLNGIKEGKQHFFIWGEVIYGDIFEGSLEHITQFCSEIVNVRPAPPDAGELFVTLHVGEAGCPEHNCYDDQCKETKK